MTENVRSETEPLDALAEKVTTHRNVSNIGVATQRPNQSRVRMDGIDPWTLVFNP